MFHQFLAGRRRHQFSRCLELAEDAQATLEMGKGIVVVALQQVGENEQQTAEEGHIAQPGIRRGTAPGEALKSAAQLLLRKAQPGALTPSGEVGSQGHSSALRVLVDRAEGHGRMVHRWLRLTYLQDEMLPERGVEHFAEGGHRVVLKVGETAALVGGNDPLKATPQLRADLGPWIPHQGQSLHLVAIANTTRGGTSPACAGGFITFHAASSVPSQ